MLSTLRNAAVAAALVTVSSCSTLASVALPAGLSDALGSVTGLSGKIGDWKSALGSSIDAAGLGQLSDFVGQAGDLGSQLGGFKDQLTGAAADPFGAIADKVGDLGSFDVSSLTGLGNGGKMAAIDGFAESADGVGKLATDFLSKFGG